MGKGKTRGKRTSNKAGNGSKADKKSRHIQKIRAN